MAKHDYKENESLFPQQEDTQSQAPVECLGMNFPNDEARRKYFLNILREKLQDPEFRKIEGFPIGSDEDILAKPVKPLTLPCTGEGWGEGQDCTSLKTSPPTDTERLPQIFHIF